MSGPRRGLQYSSHGTSSREHWTERAACRNADPEAFAPPPDQYRPMTTAEAAYALTYCARCPVTQTCLDEAIRHGDTFGIRGGVDLANAAKRRAIHTGQPISGC